MESYVCYKSVDKSGVLDKDWEEREGWQPFTLVSVASGVLGRCAFFFYKESTLKIPKNIIMNKDFPWQCFIKPKAEKYLCLALVQWNLLLIGSYQSGLKIHVWWCMP